VNSEVLVKGIWVILALVLAFTVVAIDFSNIDFLVQNGKYDVALEKLGKMLKRYTNDARKRRKILDKIAEVKKLQKAGNYFAEAKMYYKSGNYNEAYKRIVKAIEVAGEIPILVEWKNKIESELSGTKKRKSYQPMTTEEYYALAQDAVARGDYGKAIYYYSKIKELDPRFFSRKGLSSKLLKLYLLKYRYFVGVLVAVLIIGVGFKFWYRKKIEVEYKEIAPKLQRELGIVAEPEKAISIVKREEKAAEYFKEGNYLKAAAMYEKLANSEGLLPTKRGDYYAKAAQAYLAAAEIDKAIEVARKATELAPDNLNAWKQLAIAAAKRKRTENWAIAAYERVWKRVEDLDVKKVLLEYYRQKGTMTADVAELARDVYMHTKDESLEEYLALLLVNNGYKDELAIKLYEKMIKMGKHTKEMLYVWLAGMLEAGNTDIVKKEALKLVEEDPNDIDAHELLQEAYKKDEDYGTLVEIYRKLKEKYPEVAYVKKALADLEQTFSLKLEVSEFRGAGFKICKACGALNRGDASSCEKCGAPLE